MTSGIYSIFKENLMNKVVDLEADTIKIALYDDSHAFTAANTTYTTTNELATAGGYTQDGKTLGHKAVTGGTTTKWDNTDDTDSQWTAATFTAYHAVIWDDTAADSLICSIDFGGAQTVSSGTFTIQMHADGIITLA
jgi:hypothetical protein